MVYIGIDDTDSRKSMCTTYLATLVIESLIREGFCLMDYPELLRLNPNIPWKTRGNGALAISVGLGGEKKKRIGDRFWICDGDECDPESVFTIVRDIVEKNACFSDPSTNPGFVVSREKFPPSYYKKCVEELSSVDEALKILNGSDALHMGYKNARGLIGATAAVSRPPEKHTYELITYRMRECIGRDRYVERESVIAMDGTFPSTFDNYDYENKHVCIAPNSPCPVLFGIRGVDADLEGVLEILRSETPERWIVYRTNQATDDHLRERGIGELKKHTSAIVNGWVSGNPSIIRGGHVIFKLSDLNGNTIDCAAYEPTKNFRNVILHLSRGDMVVVYGGLNLYSTLNIEKIEIKELVKLHQNPVCCGKSMKSKGKNKGYKCAKCGRMEMKCLEKDRKIARGFYEVPPSARRHLSMPLKLMQDSFPHHTSAIPEKPSAPEEISFR